MKVERIYTRTIAGVARTDTIQAAAATMRRFHVGALLVIDHVEGRPKVVGIVTDRDLVLLGMAEDLDVHKPVGTLMTPVVSSIPETSDVFEALDRMREGGIRRLLVTTPLGDPAGILSIDDIVDGLATELAKAAALMKAEIRREAGDFGEGLEAA